MHKLILVLVIISFPAWCSTPSLPRRDNKAASRIINYEYLSLDELKAAKKEWESNNPEKKCTPNEIFELAQKLREEKK